MLLLLVRHALTSLTGKKLLGWTSGVSLSDIGREQADAVATRLEKIPVKAVYSSPIERCLQTAVSIASRHGLQPVTDDALGEVRYGDWTGKTFKVLYKSKGWAELKARPGDFRFPNGETIREAQVRIMNALDALRTKHRNQAVVVCSHADPIRLAVAGYLGLPLDLYGRISVAPATVSAVFFDGPTPRLLKLSDSGTYEDIVGRLERPEK